MQRMIVVAAFLATVLIYVVAHIIAQFFLLGDKLAQLFS